MVFIRYCCCPSKDEEDSQQQNNHNNNSTNNKTNNSHLRKGTSSMEVAAVVAARGIIPSSQRIDMDTRRRTCTTNNSNDEDDDNFLDDELIRSKTKFRSSKGGRTSPTPPSGVRRTRSYTATSACSTVTSHSNSNSTMTPSDTATTSTTLTGRQVHHILPVVEQRMTHRFNSTGQDVVPEDDPASAMAWLRSRAEGKNPQHRFPLEADLLRAYQQKQQKQQTGIDRDLALVDFCDENDVIIRVIGPVSSLQASQRSPHVVSPDVMRAWQEQQPSPNMDPGSCDASKNCFLDPRTATVDSIEVDELELIGNTTNISSRGCWKRSSRLPDTDENDHEGGQIITQRPGSDDSPGSELPSPNPSFDDKNNSHPHQQQAQPNKNKDSLLRSSSRNSMSQSQQKEPIHLQQEQAFQPFLWSQTFSVDFDGKQDDGQALSRSHSFERSKGPLTVLTLNDETTNPLESVNNSSNTGKQVSISKPTPVITKFSETDLDQVKDKLNAILAFPPDNNNLWHTNNRNNNPAQQHVKFFDDDKQPRKLLEDSEKVTNENDVDKSRVLEAKNSGEDETTIEVDELDLIILSLEKDKSKIESMRAAQQLLLLQSNEETAATTSASTSGTNTPSSTPTRNSSKKNNDKTSSSISSQQQPPLLLPQNVGPSKAHTHTLPNQYRTLVEKNGKKRPPPLTFRSRSVSSQGQDDSARQQISRSEGAASATSKHRKTVSLDWNYDDVYASSVSALKIGEERGGGGVVVIRAQPRQSDTPRKTASALPNSSHWRLPRSSPKLFNNSNESAQPQHIPPVSSPSNDILDEKNTEVFTGQPLVFPIPPNRYNTSPARQRRSSAPSKTRSTTLAKGKVASPVRSALTREAAEQERKRHGGLVIVDTVSRNYSNDTDEQGKVQDNRTTAPLQRSLSDVPSDVDTHTKERYLMACRILKSALIERETTLLPNERDFLQGLLDAGINVDDEHDEQPKSEARVAAIEEASKTLMWDTLFQASDRGGEAYHPRTEARSETDGSNQLTHLAVAAKPKRQRRSQDRRPSWKRSTSAAEEEILAMKQRMHSLPALVDQTTSPTVTFLGKDYPFAVLEMTESITMTVMTPSILEALRGFFPHSVAEENFWLKFSLERDGASLTALLSKVRSSKHSIIGIETTTGDVFGAFCSTPWRTQSTWYGSGESFLWRLKQSRKQIPGSAERTFDVDNEMEIYPWTGHDYMVQYCTDKSLAVGGGDWIGMDASPHNGEPLGIGLMVDSDLMGGETNSCATFDNPRLCGRSSKRKNEFEIAAMEVWTLTPCLSLEEAKKLEMRRVFIEQNIAQKNW